MSDIASLFQIVIVIAAVAGPLILLARVIGGGESGSLATLFAGPLFAGPDHSAWPRGVQEEEPKPWVFGRAAPDAA